jgi:hypothetical protein
MLEEVVLQTWVLVMSRNESARAVACAAMVVALVAGCVGSEPSGQSSADLTDGVALARAAIADGRFQDAAVLLKNVLADSSAASPENRDALELVDVMYERSGGQPIPVDFQTPDALKGLRIRFLRRLRRPDETAAHPGDHRDTIAVDAPFELRPRISALTMINASSHTVVLDTAGVGQWGGDQESNTTYFGADIDDGFETDGLYTLDISLADEAKTHLSAWFIVTRGMAKTDAVIRSPENQPLTIDPADASRNPRDLTFQFQNFTSDQRLPFENRTLYAFLKFHRIVGGVRQISTFWETRIPDPAIESLRPGEHGMPVLDPGEYRIGIDYQESRGFGSFTLSREAETLVRFFVQ